MLGGPAVDSEAFGVLSRRRSCSRRRLRRFLALVRHQQQLQRWHLGPAQGMVREVRRRNWRVQGRPGMKYFIAGTQSFFCTRIYSTRTSIVHNTCHRTTSKDYSTTEWWGGWRSIGLGPILQGLCDEGVDEELCWITRIMDFKKL